MCWGKVVQGGDSPFLKTSAGGIVKRMGGWGKEERKEGATIRM